MTTVQVALPPKLIPVFDGEADTRWSCGGRGSAKTRSFAKMAAVWGYRFGMQGISGIIVCARQFMNSLADSSLEECKRAIEDEPFLASYYEIGQNYIRSHDGRIEFAFSGLDRNIASIKSKGRILLLWVDEAEPVTDKAWDIVEPTLREEGTDWNAELWVTWNPARKKAPVESRFRYSKDPRVKGVVLNWRDNPRFPALLERKRRKHQEENPDTYDHVWEGAYVTVVAGAYFAKWLTKARQEGRIGRVGPDPLMSYKAFCDLGGTGAKADAFAIWIAQFIGREIRVLNYYEAQGQALGVHIQWLRDNGYEKAGIWLPHDGETQDRVTDTSFEKGFQKAGFSTVVIPNQGKGAAKQRIEAARKLLPICWFNEPAIQVHGGMDVLGWYHEKRSEDDRDVGLGPEHDWSSHGADAFGLMCVAYKPPTGTKLPAIKYPTKGIV